MGILTELAQFGFITSLIYLLYITINFIIKLYGRFKLGKETRFVMSNWEKSLLLISLSYILSFLI